MTPLYLDVHVPAAITDQLRRLGVDVITAQEDGAAEYIDADLLARATSLGRILFTQELIAKVTEPEDWRGQVEHLPLK